jgi:hypothetical protein
LATFGLFTLQVKREKCLYTIVCNSYSLVTNNSTGKPILIVDIGQ